MAIIYKATRVGQFGKPFTLYKFRTMVKNADKLGGSSTSDTDPRITWWGKILRKTKLDELPQLANWIKGDVALIGWRPESPEYAGTILPDVLATRPGIIGYATLYDIDEGAELAGKEDPDKYYAEVILPRKRELELWYVRNRSWSLDLWIIWETFRKLILRK